jgi:hypothetical protein
MKGGPGQTNPDDSAQCNHDSTFDCNLPHQGHPGRTERPPERELLLSFDRSDYKQAGQVQHSHEKHEEGSRQHDQ